MSIIVALILTLAAFFTPAEAPRAPEGPYRECVPMDVDGGQVCRPTCPLNGCPEPQKVETDS